MPRKKVLLFNSRLKLFPRKLKSRWTSPYTINQVTQHATIELIRKGGQLFLVNGQRINHYFRGITDVIVDEKILQCKTLWNVEKLAASEEDNSEKNK